MDSPVRTPSARLFYRLWMAVDRISPTSVLNEPRADDSTDSCYSVPPDIFRLFRSLQGEVISGDGRAVDYSRLGGCQVYSEYRTWARKLHFFDPASLATREERLAFWINVYNALILDSVIQLEVSSSIHEVPGFFWKAAYTIGGMRYSSFDIEYGILRANRAYPALPGAHFLSKDPRRVFSLRSLEPRVHFALVCAARSCPPISVYQPELIDAQLDLAASAFINHGGVVVDRSLGEARLSKIFQWYAPDFGAGTMAFTGKSRLLAYLISYLNDPEDRSYLRSGKPRVRFVPYDWSLNGLAPG